MPDPTETSPGQHRQSAFRRAVVPISIALGSIALMGWLFWSLFEDQRHDVAAARAFLSHIAAEEYAAATALMQPALAQEFGPSEFARRIGRIEAWTHISFSSRSTNGFGDMRTTELFGVGEALSGCESVLHIHLVNGQIHSFRIRPICPRVDTDA